MNLFELLFNFPSIRNIFVITALCFVVLLLFIAIFATNFFNFFISINLILVGVFLVLVDINYVLLPNFVTQISGFFGRSDIGILLKILGQNTLFVNIFSFVFISFIVNIVLLPSFYLLIIKKYFVVSQPFSSLFWTINKILFFTVYVFLATTIIISPAIIFYSQKEGVNIFAQSFVKQSKSSLYDQTELDLEEKYDLRLITDTWSQLSVIKKDFYEKKTFMRDNFFGEDNDGDGIIDADSTYGYFLPLKILKGTKAMQLKAWKNQIENCETESQLKKVINDIIVPLSEGFLNENTIQIFIQIFQTKVKKI